MSELIHIHIEWDGSKITYKTDQGVDATNQQAHNQDWISWCTHSGTLDLSWGSHPFCTAPPTHIVGHPCSGPVQVCASSGSFKYSVVLTDGAGVQHEADPKIIIVPGTGLISPLRIGLIVVAVGFGVWFVGRRLRR